MPFSLHGRCNITAFIASFTKYQGVDFRYLISKFIVIHTRASRVFYPDLMGLSVITVFFSFGSDLMFVDQQKRMPEKANYWLF